MKAVQLGSLKKSVVCPYPRCSSCCLELSYFQVDSKPLSFASCYSLIHASVTLSRFETTAAATLASKTPTFELVCSKVDLLLLRYFDGQLFTILLQSYLFLRFQCCRDRMLLLFKLSLYLPIASGFPKFD